jgi:hypothetical protein
VVEMAIASFLDYDSVSFVGCDPSKKLEGF